MPSDVVFLIGACVIVVTCTVLGMSWLKTPALGLPAGVWLLLFAYVGYRLTRSRVWRDFWMPTHSTVVVSAPTCSPEPRGSVEADSRQARFEFARGERTQATAGDFASQFQAVRANGTLNREDIARLHVGRAIGLVWSMISGDGARLGWAEFRLNSIADRSTWPVRPLRVGIDAPARVAQSLKEARGEVEVEWVSLPGMGTPQRARELRELDAAVVADAGGHLTLYCAQSASRPAAWQDWSATRGASFGGVFPLRLDTASTHLGEGDEACGVDAHTTRLLVESCALLSRVGPRLSFADRLAGRRPIELGRFRGGALLSGARPDVALERVLARLGETVVNAQRAGRRSTVCEIAARLAGAWAVGLDCGLSPGARGSITESAWRILSDEPAAALRALATRVASYEDEEAVTCAFSAARLIAPSDGLDADPLSSLQHELARQDASEADLGRIAAGVCLTIASTPSDKVEYLMEDIAEEIRLAPCLAGRDADQAMILKLMRACVSARGSLNAA